MKFLLKIFAIISISFLAGCVSGETFVDQIKVRRLAEKNPTSFVFKADVGTIHLAIRNEFSDREFYRMKLSSIANSSGEFHIQRLFDSAQYINDYYLANPYEAIEPSRLYADENGKPLMYFAEFLIHITPMNDDSTKVEIQTRKAYVITGKAMRMGDRGGNYIGQNVKPTTIEEYEILLKIGEALGVKNEMPALILPK